MTGLLLAFISELNHQANAGLSDHLMTAWQTNLPGTSNDTSTSIPTTDSGDFYDANWNKMKFSIIESYIGIHFLAQ